MHAPDIHPLLALALSVPCMVIALLAAACVRTFWRVERHQPRKTVLWCRFVAVFSLALTAGFGGATILYLWTGVYGVAMSLYGLFVQ